MYNQIKTGEPEMGLLVSKWKPKAVLKRSRNIVPDNQICKIIQHRDSLKTGKCQQKCQMWSVSGASTVLLMKKHSDRFRNFKTGSSSWINGVSGLIWCPLTHSLCLQ